MKLMLLFVLVAMVSGCATQQYWFKARAGKYDYQADWGECTSRTAQAYPNAPQYVQLTSGYSKPVYTDCTGSTGGGAFSASCRTSGGGYVPPIGLTVDGNADARNKAEISCMYGKGWALVDKQTYEAWSRIYSDSGLHRSSESEQLSEKHVVEVNGYCNETDDCVTGLMCKDNTCIRNKP